MSSDTGKAEVERIFNEPDEQFGEDAGLNHFENYLGQMTFQT